MRQHPSAEAVQTVQWTPQDAVLLTVLDEQFDAVYEELLCDGLVCLSDELQQRLRAIVLREMLAEALCSGSEAICAVLDSNEYDALRQMLRDRIGQHLLQPSVLDRMPYNPEDAVVMLHQGFVALRDELRRRNAQESWPGTANFDCMGSIPSV